MNELIAIIAILLTFIGYVPYIRDILKGKTRPHPYSWFVWGFATIVIAALQLSDNAGVGAYVTLCTGSIAFLVFILSLRFSTQITRSDTIFFVAALVATAVWLVAEQPVLSITLLVGIDMLGFIPTIRKSWNTPYSETLTLYQIGTLRHFLSIFALQSYSYVTVLFPATWMLANLLFSLTLIIRRRQVGH